MEEMCYALVTILEALRLEIRAQSYRLQQAGSEAATLEVQADKHAKDALTAGQALLNRKES